MSSSVKNNKNTFIDKLNNSYDNFIIQFLRNIGLTPNLITTFSIILSLLAIDFYKKSNNKYASLFFLLSRIVNNFGDKMSNNLRMSTEICTSYDNIADIISIVPIFYMVLLKIIKKDKYLHLLIIIIFTAGYLINYGCKSIHTKNKKNIYYLKKSCPLHLIKTKNLDGAPISNKEKSIIISKKTSIFGYSTFIIMCSIIIYFN